MKNILLLIFGLATLFKVQCAEQWEAHADSLYTKAQFYSENGAYDLALENYFKACQAYESMGSIYDLAKTYNGVGLTYKRLENPEMSKKYYFAALEKLEKDPDQQLISYVANNIGIVYEEQGKIDSAEVFYTRSLNIKLAFSDSAGIARSYNNLAGIMLNRGDYQGALNRYFKSKEIKEKLKDTVGIFRIHANIANVYGYLGKLDSVVAYLNAGMKFREMVPDLELYTPYYRNYSELYRALGEYKVALAYSDSLLQIQAQIFNHRMASELSKFEAAYELDRKEQLLKDERIKNELLEEKQERQQLRQYVLISAIVFLCAFLALLFVLGYYRLRNARQKQLILENERKLQEMRMVRAEEQKELLEKEIEIQSKELLSYSTLSLQKQEMLNELKTKIDTVQSSYTDIPEEMIKALNTILKSGLNMQEEWDRFKIHFEQVHESFFHKLSEDFPNLTQADFRHCAYIKIGLTTKEIATLLNISPSSVQKSRVRLKKKMQLPVETDLIEFIQRDV